MAALLNNVSAVSYVCLQLYQRIWCKPVWSWQTTGIIRCNNYYTAGECGWIYLCHVIKVSSMKFCVNIVTHEIHYCGLVRNVCKTWLAQRWVAGTVTSHCVNWCWLCVSWKQLVFEIKHYNDVIMRLIASQTTSITIVYSTAYTDTYKKCQNIESLAFYEVNSPMTGEFPAQRTNNAENVTR